jgi:hypothetical protein
MSEMFFYKRKEISGGTPEAPEYKEYVDGFNLNKVIRAVTLEDKRMIVLLDDIHERSQEVPDVDVRTNKVKGTKRQRDVFQTEIYLTKEDAERFYKLFSSDIV